MISIAMLYVTYKLSTVVICGVYDLAQNTKPYEVVIIKAEQTKVKK